MNTTDRLKSVDTLACKTHNLITAYRIVRQYSSLHLYESKDDLTPAETETLNMAAQAAWDLVREVEELTGWSSY